MQKIFHYINRFLFFIILGIIILYSSLYIILSINSVQQYIKKEAIDILSKKTGTEITIERISINPFNKIILHNVSLYDLNDENLFSSTKISASFKPLQLLKKNLILTNVQLIGFNANIYKETPETELNFSFLKDAFKKDEINDNGINLDIHLNSLILRRGILKYNVLSEPLNDDKFDKNHIELKDFSSTISFHSIDQDSLNFILKKLSFKERSGLDVKNLKLNLTANMENIELKNFSLDLNKSNLKIDSLNVNYNSIETFISDSTLFNLSLNNSLIYLSDLSPFVPKLKNYNSPLNLNIKAEGTVNDIHINDIKIYSKDKIDINANGYINGITNISESYMFGKILKSEIRPEGLKDILNNFTILNNNICDKIDNTGSVIFNGELSGFFNELVAYGEFKTKHGSINTDILIGQIDDSFNYKGSLVTESLNLKEILNDALLGNIAFSFYLDGKQNKNGSFNGSITGNFPELEFKDYSYKNLACNLDIDAKSFTGNIYLDDDNGNIYVNGNINLNNKIPSFNFEAVGSKLMMNNLNLAPRFEDSELNFKINADFKGDKIDNAQGILHFDSLLFINQTDSFLLKELSVQAFNQENPQTLRIESDIVNGQISGRYQFSTLLDSFKKTLSKSFPYFNSSIKKKESDKNEFEFSLRIEKCDQLWKVLNIPLKFSKSPFISGYYSEKNNIIKIEGNIPQLNYKNHRIRDTYIYIDQPDEKFNFSLNTTRLNKNNQPFFLSLNIDAFNGIFDTRIDWSNNEQNVFKGSIITKTTLTTKNKAVKSEFEIKPSEIIINDSLWNMGHSYVTIDSGKVIVNDFVIKHADQFINIDGVYSQNSNDTLNLDLRDIDLDYIFNIVNKSFIMFGGYGTGNFKLYSQDRIINIKTDSLKVSDFTYNDELLGDLNLSSSFNTDELCLYLNGLISQKDVRPTAINGGIYFKQDSLMLDFNAHKLNVAFIKIWTDKILSGIKGTATADMRLYGKFRGLNLEGKAHTDGISFGIDYLNTKYIFADSLNFTNKGIAIKNKQVFDTYGNYAIVNGNIEYEYFKDIKYDININIPQNRPFLAFNVTEKINPIYWGTIFANGNAHIYGNEQETRIDVIGRSTGNSRLFFSLDNNLSANDYQFLTFRDKTVRPSVNIEEDDYIDFEDTESVSNHDLYLNLQVEATPEATVNLIMDPQTGDNIKGSGSGNLRLEYNKTNDFRIFGNYTIDKGNYYFNLQDVISRDFSIQHGSTVNFTGNPLNAQLNIKAIYQVTASLGDLDKSFSESKELSRLSVPVQCILNIDGDLRRPDLSFDINLPTVSQDIDRQVKSIIATDEMMNRQIIYLMVLNKFYTPDYMAQNSQQNRYSDLTSVASSTLSSQLSNLLGQISDNWNIGTNIRSEKGDFSDVEVELALSSQLLNNRLLFNGNLGYRENQISDNKFIGDFDLEYLLNPTGSLRLKAYNHYNDRNYSIKSALATQGVGIMIKRDFDTFYDLFTIFMRRKNKTKN